MSFSRGLVALGFFLLIVILTPVIFQSAPDNPDKGPGFSSNLEEAVWLREQGLYQKSIEILEKELYQKDLQNDLVYQTQCWLNLALNYVNLNEMTRAENAFIFSQTLSSQAGENKTQDFARKSLEIIKLLREAREKGQDKKFEEAEQLLFKALKLSQDWRLKELELRTSVRLASLHWHSGNQEKYYELSKKAQSLADILNNKIILINMLANCAEYHSKKRNFCEAYQHAIKALSIAESHKIEGIRGLCLLNLGSITYSLGQYDLSAYYFREALKEHNKLDEIDTYISLLYGLAISIHKSCLHKDNDSAIVQPDLLLKIALELSRKAGLLELEARILNNLGYVLIGEDPEASENYSLQALRLGQRIKARELVAASLNNLATVYFNRGLIKKARDFFIRALEEAKKADYWREVWNDYAGLARCYEKERNYGQALNHYRQALETLSRVRDKIGCELYRISFDREKREVYEGIIRCTVAVRKSTPGPDMDELVFATLNQVKARAFLAELQNYAQGDREFFEDKELKELNLAISEFMKQADNLGKTDSLTRLQELEHHYLRLLSSRKAQTIVESNQKFHDLRLQMVQKSHLEPGQVILDYYIGKQESYCFLISQDKFHIFKLPPEKEVEKSVKLYIKLLADRRISEADLTLTGTRLTHLLLPLSEISESGFESLIIIPDGILHYLPFETLRIQAKETGREQYLIERFRISYNPSVAFLSLSQKSVSNERYEKELLALANPTVNKKELSARLFYLNGLISDKRQELEALPFSEEEVRKIARLFPARGRDLYLNRRATESRLKSLNLSRYRIIHIACHGLISEQFPLRSALVLAGESSEDGLLTIREIYGLRVKPQLLVLSACQTSRGGLEKTEGVIGFPRTFLLAGAGSVVSSLWAVDDQGTSELMIEFYRQLNAGRRRDEALRLAKLKLINSAFSHPYYWAGFILYGQAGNVY